MSTKNTKTMMSIIATIQSLTPPEIIGWAGFGARKIDVLDIVTEESRVTHLNAKFHAQIRVQVALVEDIEGKEITYRAFVPGGVSGILTDGVPLVMSAQIDASESYLAAQTEAVPAVA
jgi:hypothetical protein